MKNWINHWEENCEQFKARCMQDRDSFNVALKKPRTAQEAVFADILSQMAGSDFANAHQFSEIETIADFQQRVPIRDYDELSVWIDEEVKRQGGVLTKHKITRWLKTSGSTGNSKKIPYTQHWMSKYRVPALGVLWSNYILTTPEMLAHPFATLDTQTVRENPDALLNGIPYQGITNRYPPIDDSDWLPPWYDAPWFTESVPAGYENRMYYRLRYFITRDLRAITTINPSTLIALKHHLELNKSRLIAEIRSGEVDGRKGMTPGLELAKKIEAILAKPDYTFKDIWPNLTLISCWTSATASLYKQQLEALFPDVDIVPFMSCGTEGIVTLPIDDHPITGPLAINQGLYEFLPASVDIQDIIKNKKCVKALLFNELEDGQEYHLIMTQANGLCRYAVGDIYKVTGYYKKVPRIEYSRRAGTYYSFTGEKITEKQLLDAIEQAAGQCQLNVGLFMSCPIFSDPPYYRMIIEVDADKKTKETSMLFENALNACMSQLNEEYSSKLSSQRLGGFKVELVETGHIERFQEQEKASANAIQYKFKPFQNDETAIDKIMAQVV